MALENKGEGTMKEQINEANQASGNQRISLANRRKIGFKSNLW
jgi:hypothetical protein